MSKQRDPNSKRSKRRANRNFTASRPVRRAANRLSIAMNGYRANDPSATQPGAQKHW